MIDWSKGLIDLSNVRLFVVGVISIIKSESIIFATSLTNTFWSVLYYCSVLEQHVFTSDLWNHSAYILSFCTPSFVFGHPEHLGHISHTKNSPRCSGCVFGVSFERPPPFILRQTRSTEGINYSNQAPRL